MDAYIGYHGRIPKSIQDGLGETLAIGRGSYSAVHLAFRRRSYPSPTIHAVKSAPLSSASLLQREEAILTELHGCPQIISCFGHDITTDTAGDLLYMLVLYN
ncbi:hypothetical protein MA16_Dca019539 [Dendrobium catenatum]|uniref:Protein kinase domain-containing protein n=1 Tax=Dendrobium catenatum TaxID=906689 RepID=A0A2I0WKX1_9ASPA|nr:hypothetical protein MA16_Dca019539 [Dendrobium catenatum]